MRFTNPEVQSSRVGEDAETALVTVGVEVENEMDAAKSRRQFGIRLLYA